MIETTIELIGQLDFSLNGDRVEIIGNIDPGYASDKYIQDAINKGISTAINSKLEESY